uniref:Uncharacterized protein n=1 Tax=Chrysotila carterae TaxID=13221 RepID=A0A7S4BDP6_CHRCT
MDCNRLSFLWLGCSSSRAAHWAVLRAFEAPLCATLAEGVSTSCRPVDALHRRIEADRTDIIGDATPAHARKYSNPCSTKASAGNQRPCALPILPRSKGCLQIQASNDLHTSTK